MSPTPRPLPSPDPALAAGEGVWLRRWRVADGPALVAAWRDPEIARWTAVPEHVTLASARAWIEGERARRAAGAALDLVIALTPDGPAVGEVGISHVDWSRSAALVGYWVAGRHRGLGLAATALVGLGGFLAEGVGIHTLLARCHPENVASIATARKAGYQSLGEDHQGWLVLRSPPAE